MPENSWRLQPKQLLGVAHTDDVWTHTIPQTGGKAAVARWPDQSRLLPSSIPAQSPPPPPSIQNAHLWVAVGRLGLFDGCLCERLWVLEERGWAAVPVLTILGQFSWIKSNLLTRKRKQVNWPESGHKNFYCCGWNVRNVATLFECDVGLAFIILRRLWVTWRVKANEHVQPRMTRAKTLWVNILSNIFTHALYQADEERSEAAIKQ